MKRSLVALSLLLSSIVALALACTGAQEPSPTATTAPAVQPTAPTGGPAATPTTAPVATPTAAQPAGQAPTPKNPKGTIAYGQSVLLCAPGVNTTYCEFYDGQGWGIGEDLFTWEWNPDGTVNYEVGELAVKWDLAPDGRKVVIETRQGVQFHKGWGEMTAEDVAWSYNMVNPKLTPHSIAPSASYFSTLFGTNPAKALDKNHVEYTFASVDTHWNTYMMNANGFVGLLIHSKQAFDKNGEEWMKDNVVATGPLQVESWVRDDRAVLTRFDQHWKYKPQIEKVIIQAIPEDSTRVAALQTGELDVAELAIKSVNKVLEQGFKTTSSGNASQQGLIFSGNLWEDKHALTGEPLDTASSPVYVNDLPWIGNPWKPQDSNNPQGMDDMEQARLVRWAIAMAIDRAGINKQFLNDLGWPVHMPYIDEKSPYWDTKWEYPYDLAKANEFLDMAGFKKGKDGTRFEMPIFVSTGHTGGLGEEITDAISGMLSQIGIRSQVLKYPYAVFRPSLVGRTATVPRLTSGDDGQTIFPFDWPAGIEETSLSRGGYCICYETPKGAEIYLKMAAELDKQKRIELKKEYFDYMYHWALKPGVVAVPALTVYNPNSIKEWQMDPTAFGTSAFHKIVPAR